jgi:lipopolysaccharide biosynthesis regulator YciM
MILASLYIILGMMVVALAIAVAHNRIKMPMLLQQMAMELTAKQQTIASLTNIITTQHEYIKNLQEYREQSKAKLEEIVNLLPSLQEQVKDCNFSEFNNRFDRPAAVVMFQKLEDVRKLLKTTNPELAQQVEEILSK